MKFIISLIENEGIMSVVAALVAAFGSVHIFKSQKRYSLTKQRYETFVAPLYNLVEPYMYRSISDDNLNRILDFIDTHSAYAMCDLLETTNLLKKNKDQETYCDLCDKIGRDYDKCRSRLGLKARSLGYRVNNDLYRNQGQKNIIWLSLFFNSILQLFAFLGFCLAFLALILAILIVIQIN